ncbi:MAG TPA: nucleotidyltransferase family protein [Actinomycetota bacterium]
MILAAGASTRLGRPKQLLPLAGKPVLQHVLDAAAGSPVDDIILVLGHLAPDIEEAVRLPANARLTVNPDFPDGLASSLRMGLAAAGSSGAAAVLLGDQPGIRADVIARLVDAWRTGQGPVVQAVYRGRPGHPTMFDRSLWGDLRLVEGDEGARWLLARNPQWVVRIEVGGEPPVDIDTDADYAKIRSSFARSSGSGPPSDP